jgi:predicted transcriptional regulator
MKKNKHLGSNFDDFLSQENLLEECTAGAVKFVLAQELQRKMEKEHISKSEIARQLNTSRTGVDRILDENNTSITLNTLGKIALFIGKKLEIKLI